MIIIRLMGGLGNQLQQYALYQKFISLGKDVRLDTSWFDDAVQDGMKAPRKLELDYFEYADYKKACAEDIVGVLGYNPNASGNFFEKIKKIICRKFLSDPSGRYGVYFTETKMYHPEIFEMDNAYLEGYWAADKYYADVLDEIRKKLAFSHINDENRILGADIAKNACDGIHTCSVHIRRGDYLDPENAAMFGNIATEKYYDSALGYVLMHHPDTHFYIFSDDPEYVAERYGNDKNCSFVDINHGENSRFDIYLMSLCDSHICANSTFSYWGTRLDEKLGKKKNESAGHRYGELIRTSIHKNTQVFVPEEMQDLWQGWVIIDPDGWVIIAPDEN